MAKVYRSRSARRLKGSLLENHFQCAKCIPRVQSIVTGGGSVQKRACGLKTLLKVMAGRCNGTLRLIRRVTTAQRQASALPPDAPIHIGVAHGILSISSVAAHCIGASMNAAMRGRS